MGNESTTEWRDAACNSSLFLQGIDPENNASKGWPWLLLTSVGADSKQEPALWLDWWADGNVLVLRASEKHQQACW